MDNKKLALAAEATILAGGLTLGVTGQALAAGKIKACYGMVVRY